MTDAELKRLHQVARAADDSDRSLGACGDPECCGGDWDDHTVEPHHVAAFYKAFTPAVVRDLLDDRALAVEALRLAKESETKARMDLRAHQEEHLKPTAADLAPLQVPIYVEQMRAIARAMTQFCDRVETSK